MAGEAEFHWKNLYGNVIQVEGILGEDQLVVADPKALSQILSSTSQHFAKRKILNPGFGVTESQAFLAISQASAQSMVVRWIELVNTGNSDKIVLDIPGWVSRATLDTIGQDSGAFDVQLGSLDNAETPLAKSYQGMMMTIFGTPSVLQIFVQEALKYILKLTVKSWVKHTPNHCAEHLHEVNNVVTATARSMVTEKAESLLQGKGSRDIFTLLVKANMDAKAKNKLSDEGLYSQMCVILFGGHETTLNTETLWYHCVVPQLYCMAAQDYILPLSQLITMESGELMHENMYQRHYRNKDMWGEDADVFNPDHWLDGIAKDKKEAATGVYLSLVIKVQAFLVEILSEFEISLTQRKQRSAVHGVYYSITMDIWQNCTFEVIK
ncbi:cytochrome P450 [Pisolithus sp. B1]|nr:cytochrome P450 [Pisolithus sp. B1]